MSVYTCYDCNTVFLCEDCTRKHNDHIKYGDHVIQLSSDSFILNCRFKVTQQVFFESRSDIKCLPNGEVIVLLGGEHVVKTFSVIGIQRREIQLEDSPLKMTVVDKNTVAVLLSINSIALVDIQQIHVQYIRNIAMPNSAVTLIYIENEFYISNEHGIVVIDMSGSEKRRITLSFIPNDMCYDVNSQRIYCIDIYRSELICIDRDGTIIFTFTNPSMINLTDLTTDNEGNALVLCEKEEKETGYVIKVDSNGEKSKVVITNIQMASIVDSRICYDHSTNSVVIASCFEVYNYKKK